MRSEELTALAAGLAAALGPVSFYDVVCLVRRIGTDDPPEPVLARLLELSEAPHLTDGARAELDAYLRATAARHHKERQLAAAPLGYDSNGRTVRAAAGSTLRLRLDERPRLGMHWGNLQATGSVRCSQRERARAHEATLEIDIHLGKAGRAEIALEEIATAKGRGKPRRYVLSVAIEG